MAKKQNASKGSTPSRKELGIHDDYGIMSDMLGLSGDDAFAFESEMQHLDNDEDDGSLTEEELEQNRQMTLGIIEKARDDAERAKQSK